MYTRIVCTPALDKHMCVYMHVYAQCLSHIHTYPTISHSYIPQHIHTL